MVTKTKQCSEEAIVANMDWKSSKQLQKLFPLVDPENINLWSDPWDIPELIKIQMREEIVRAIIDCRKRYTKLIKKYNECFENKVTRHQLAHEILGEVQQEIFITAVESSKEQ